MEASAGRSHRTKDKEVFKSLVFHVTAYMSVDARKSNGVWKQYSLQMRFPMIGHRIPSRTSYAADGTGH
eukprot:5724455-Prymnesium_polylepis.2